LKYNKIRCIILPTFAKENLLKGVMDMTSYMLIWMLLQEIEKLQEELNTYKNNTKENGK